MIIGSFLAFRCVGGGPQAHNFKKIKMAASPQMLIMRLVMQIAVQSGSLSVKQLVDLSDELCNDLPYLEILQEQMAFKFTSLDLYNAFKAMPNEERDGYVETFHANFPGWDLGLFQQE
jgi:hypothetical protein